jgi:hypothetical protein
MATGPVHRVSQALLDFLAQVPPAAEHQHSAPAAAARKCANKAAAKAALASGGLALPPGPLGWLTILPELTTVWRIQAQLVSDIAAIYGKQAQVSREQMLYCLFKHLAAQALRDLVVRVGERVLIRQASLQVLQTITRKLGVHITQRILGRGVARWMPLVGAAGIGAYAWYDTRQVGATAMALFGQGAGNAHEAGPVCDDAQSADGI